jgi:WD40 repeat protein
MLTSLGGNIFKVIGVQSGRSLDIAASGTANGTKVELWDYSGGSNQQMAFSGTDSGYYRITPQNATGSCLDVNGASTADGALVQLWQYLSGNNQQWSPQAP